jgi:hypothetical protein
VLRGNWFDDPRRFANDAALFRRALKRNNRRLDVGVAAELVYLLSKAYRAHPDRENMRVVSAYVRAMGEWARWVSRSDPVDTN